MSWPAPAFMSSLPLDCEETAFLSCAAARERIMARPAVVSGLKRVIFSPLYVPVVGSEPMKVGVITTWSPRTK